MPPLLRGPSPSGSRPLATGSRRLARCRGIYEACGLEPKRRHRSHFGSKYTLGCCACAGLLLSRVRALRVAQTRLAAARRREVLLECKPDATREASKQNTTRGRVAQESRLARYDCRAQTRVGRIARRQASALTHPIAARGRGLTC